MGRPKKSVPAPAETPAEEDISQEEPEDEPEAEEEPEDDEPTPAVGGKAISGAEAVRRAMADGKDSPGDISDYAFEQFGLTIPKTMVSSYKSQEKARQAKKAGGAAPAPKKAAAPRTQSAEKPVTQREFSVQQTSSSLGGIIEDIDDIKRMLATHGEDGLKKLIEHLK